MINSIRHAGIVVRDLERAADFYRSLGFVDNNSATEEGDFIDQVTGLKGTKLEWIKLKAPDGNLIELLKYHSHSEDEEISKQKSYKLAEFKKSDLARQMEEVFPDAKLVDIQEENND